MTPQDRRFARFYLLALLLVGAIGSAVLLGEPALFAAESTAVFPASFLLGVGGLYALRPRRVARVDLRAAPPLA